MFIVVFNWGFVCCSVCVFLTTCLCFNVRCVFVYLLMFPGLFYVGFGVLFLSIYSNVFYQHCVIFNFVYIYIYIDIYT